MTEISRELAEQMAQLLRDLHADHLKYNLHDREQDFCVRTAAIVAALPHPRLSQARAIAAAIRGGLDTVGNKIRAGEWDDHQLVRCALAAFDAADRDMATRP